MDKKRYFSKVLDFAILSLFTIIITFQPYFKHGEINFYETGIYLPVINALFHGQVLFRDVFVLRGPLEIFIPAFIMKIFTPHIVYLYLYFYIGTIITMLFYVFFAIFFLRKRIFLYAFVFSFIARTFPRVAFHIWGGIRFGFGILPIIFITLFLKYRKRVYLFISGLCCGIGFLFSPEIGAFGGLSVLLTLCFYGLFYKNWMYVIKNLSMFLFGCFLSLAPFFVYLIKNHALVSYIEINFTFLRNMWDAFDPAYVSPMPRSLLDALFALLPGSDNFKHMTPTYFYIAVCLYFIIKVFRGKWWDRDFYIVPLFFYSVFMYIGAFRNLEGHQFEMALQPEKLLVFIFIERLYFFMRGIHKPILGKIRGKTLAYIFMILVFTGFIGYSIQRFNHRFITFKLMVAKVKGKNTENLLPYSADASCQLQIKRAKGVILACNKKKEIETIVNFIKTNTSINTPLFTYPYLGTYNFLADRLCLSRFCTTQFTWASVKWHEEMMDRLRKLKPRYILIKKDLSELEPFFKSRENKFFYDDVMNYLRKNYVDMLVTDGVRVMVRKEHRRN